MLNPSMKNILENYHAGYEIVINHQSELSYDVLVKI